MAFNKNITLLILSFSLLIAPHLAQPELSPAVSPSIASSPQSASVPSPGPANGPSPNYVSFPPSTISDLPSASIAPTADAPGPSSTLAMSSPDDDPPTKLDSLAMSSPDDEPPAKLDSLTMSSPDDDDGGPAKLDSITTSSTDDGDDEGPAGYDSISTSSTDDDDDEDDEDPSKFDVSSILGTSSIAGEVAPNVKKICDSTDHSSLCLITIAPLLKDGKDDVQSVLEASIGAGAKLSDYGLSLAKSLSEKPGTRPELLSVLKDCTDSYDTAVYNYQNAIDALHERDIGTMNSMLSAVITNVGDCQDGLSGIGEKSLFAGVSDKLTNVTSNCLAIVSLLG